MDKKQLRTFITDTLKNIDSKNLYSEAAVNLLMGTAAQESARGKYIRQLGNGPALGIFQMEPKTFEDIRDNFLFYHNELKGEIIGESNLRHLLPTALEYNLRLAVLFARLQYYRRPDPLPTTLAGMAAYWKRWYNTPAGKGTEAEFIRNYKKYVE